MDYTFKMTLAKWLELATQELMPDARRRIRAEIETHYADAYATARESGLTEAEADGAALAALGDPSAAWHRFRKTYLRKSEKRRVYSLMRHYDMSRREQFTLTILGAFLFFGVIVALFLLSRKQSGTVLPLLSMSFLLGLTVNKVYRHLQARLLFDPRIRNAAFLYKWWVLPIRTLFYVALLGLLFYFFSGKKFSGQNLKPMPVVLFYGLFLLLLVIRLVFDFFYGFLPLLHKVRSLNASHSPIGSDPYA